MRGDARVDVLPSLDVSQRFADSPFTIVWILTNLQLTDSAFIALSATSTVLKVHGGDISEGKGFVAKVYNVIIEFADQNQPYQVILKVPGTESFNKALSGTEVEESSDNNPLKEHHVASLHNSECEFYSKFAPHLTLSMPMVFKCQEYVPGKQPGAILMESLVGKADNSPIYTGATLPQIYKVVDQLVALHAYFLCLPLEEWTGKYKRHHYDTFAETDFFGPFFEKTRSLKPGVFDAGIEEFTKYKQSVRFMTYTTCDVYKDIGLPPVLTHGDFCNNNILWKVDSRGHVTNDLAVIIDWQAIHEGCMTNDLARFLVISVDGETRREFENEILQYYYDSLAQALQDKGRNVDFTYDQIKRAYRANFILHAMVALAVGPFLLMNKEWSNEERPVKEAQLEKFLLRARFAVEDALECLKELPEEKLM